MSDILTLQERLQQTGAELARLEQAIAANPSPALISMTRSVKDHYEWLEEEFLREADGLGLDVCNYRIFGKTSGHLPIGAVGQVLAAFQSMISNLYASVKQGVPRSSRRVSAEIQSETNFGFGYTYAGSLGFVLTLPNERRLLGDSKLDETMRLVGEITTADSPAALAPLAKRLGPAPIRAVYAWSKAHATADLGAQIQWQRGMDAVRTTVFAEPDQLSRLSEAIERTSDEMERRLTLTGTLVAIDTARRTFRMAFDVGKDVRGSIAESVSFDEPVRVPVQYRATLVKTTIVHYATEVNEEKWLLEQLEPV